MTEKPVQSMMLILEITALVIWFFELVERPKPSNLSIRPIIKRGAKHLLICDLKAFMLSFSVYTWFRIKNQKTYTTAASRAVCNNTYLA